MDDVEFKRGSSNTDNFQFSTPSGPIDPETGANSPLKSKSPGKMFKKPELPDFSKLREKAIKAEAERKASDTLEFDNSINFARENKDKLEKTRNDLMSLLKNVTDPTEKNKLNQEKEAIDKKLDAIGKLFNIVGSSKGNMVKNLSQLTDREYKQALQLQKLIFGRPSETKDIEPPKPLLQNNNNQPNKTKANTRNFYRPGKFKSFYLEKRNKENN
ncbi:MAG: hypothetical protein ACQETH_11275 [Candidatus Rifleibacteriota bacterium]